MARLTHYSAAILIQLLLAGCTGATPAELFDEAQRAFSRGEVRAASIQLKNLLREEPDHAKARMLLAQVSLALGDGAAAESNLRRAGQLGVDAERLQLSLMQSLALQGRLAEVLKQYESGPALEGETQVTALRLVAAAHRGLDALDAAEANYREALALASDPSEAQAELADLLVATRRFREARELVGSMLAADSSNPAALVLRGRLELAAARSDRAAATFREALEHADATGPHYREALAQLVIALLGQQAGEEAAAAVNELLALEPRNPIARLLKARVDAQQGALGDARREIEQVVAEFPDYAPANRLLGSINLDLGNVGQARMYLQAAFNADTADHQARGLLAETLLRQGEIDAAHRLLEPFLGEAESDALSLALAGRASSRGGEERADELFDRSQQSVSLVGLAMVYVGAGELERARRVLEHTELNADQSDTLLAYLVAVARFRQGDVEGATEAAQSALERVGQSAPWRVDLERVLAEINASVR